jgi:hypothetical protein
MYIYSSSVEYISMLDFFVIFSDRDDWKIKINY